MTQQGHGDAGGHQAAPRSGTPRGSQERTSSRTPALWSPLSATVVPLTPRPPAQKHPPRGQISEPGTRGPHRGFVCLSVVSGVWGDCETRQRGRRRAGARAVSRHGQAGLGLPPLHLPAFVPRRGPLRVQGPPSPDRDRLWKGLQPEGEQLQGLQSSWEELRPLPGP